MTSKTIDYGLLITRTVLGLIMAAHGAQKLFIYGYAGVIAGMGEMGIPFPGLSAALIIATELGGGLLLMSGLLTRFAASALAFAMTVAVVQVHLPAGFFGPAGVEFPLMLAAASLGLVLTGAGAVSLDALLARRRAATPQTMAPPDSALRRAA